MESMRSVFALTLLIGLLGGCTPEIPVKPDFATTALKPTGNIPPEFSGFNNYQPGVNPLLDRQMCATPYVLQVEQMAAAVPGTIVTATGQCQTYFPSFRP
jgi:hypothetical protein